MTKEEIEIELLKCLKDVTYFSKHIKIKSNLYGIVPFDLYGFQYDTLNKIVTNDKVIIVKARQMGISNLVALYILHSILFKRTSINVFSTTHSNSKEIIKKVKFMYKNLPDWIKEFFKLTTDNTNSFGVSTGSLVEALSSNLMFSTSGITVIDEADFIPNLKDIVSQSSGSGKFIILSSPNEILREFYDMWTNAESGKNGFVPIKLPWNLHPDRDSKWRAEKTAEMGIREAKQEYDAEFTGTGHTVVEAEELEYIEKNNLLEPIDKGWEAKELWTWQFPIAGKRYSVLVDTAKGDGGDDSTIQVIDIETSEQVAEFQGQLPPTELAKKARLLAIDYNEAVIVIESTGIGVATIEAMEQLGYSNLYREPKSQQQNNDENFDRYGYLNNYSSQNEFKTGFAMTWNVRPVAVTNFLTMVRRKEIIIRSRRTFTELKTFIWINGKAQASRGSHDDLIMPLIIYSRIRDHIFVLNNKSYDIRKTILDNITISTPHLNNFNSYSQQFQAQQDMLNRFGLTNDWFKQ